MTDDDQSNESGPRGDDRKWFYQSGTECSAPISLDQLVQKLRSGSLPLDTKVWTPGMQAWSPAAEIPDLVARIPPTPSSPEEYRHDDGDASHLVPSDERPRSPRPVTGSAFHGEQHEQIDRSDGSNVAEPSVDRPQPPEPDCGLTGTGVLLRGLLGGLGIVLYLLGRGARMEGQRLSSASSYIGGLILHVLGVSLLILVFGVWRHSRLSGPTGPTRGQSMDGIGWLHLAMSGLILFSGLIMTVGADQATTPADMLFHSLISSLDFRVKFVTGVLALIAGVTAFVGGRVAWIILRSTAVPLSLIFPHGLMLAAWTVWRGIGALDQGTTPLDAPATSREARSEQKARPVTPSEPRDVSGITGGSESSDEDRGLKEFSRWSGLVYVAIVVLVLGVVMIVQQQPRSADQNADAPELDQGPDKITAAELDRIFDSMDQPENATVVHDSDDSGNEAGMVLNLLIIALILGGLTVYRYLNAYLEQDELPYSLGFGVCVACLKLFVLISLVWMFGVIAGIVVFVLCLLQVVYSAGLWVFNLPWLLSMQRTLTFPKVNPLVYGGFPYLVATIALLTVFNFFVSSYKSMWDVMGEDVWTPVVAFVLILVAGNIARIIIMSRVMRE